MKEPGNVGKEGKKKGRKQGKQEAGNELKEEKKEASKKQIKELRTEGNKPREEGSENLRNEGKNLGLKRQKR